MEVKCLFTGHDHQTFMLISGTVTVSWPHGWTQSTELSDLTPDWIPYNKHWTIVWFYLRVGPPRSLKTFCSVFCLLVFVASNCTVLEVKTGTKDGLSSVMETLTFSIERKNCSTDQLHWCKREKMHRPPPPPLNNADLQAGVCLQYSVFWVKYGVVDVRSRVEYE